jgi:MFS family permease
MSSTNKSTEKDIEEKVYKVDVKQTLLIGFGFLSAMIAWSFYNFKIPIILNGITGKNPGEWTRIGLLGTDPIMEIVGGLIMVLDNIVAIILQPYFGRLSDRLESKYGRRSPFLMLGLPIAAFCIFILPFMSIIGVFIGVILVFNLAMAFYRAPIITLLPDKTPPQTLSTANSFISLMGGLGFVLGFLIPFIVGLIPGTVPVVTGSFSTQVYFWQDFWGFFIAGGLMVFCLVMFLWKVKEVPTGDKFFHIAKRPIKFDVYTQTVIPYKEGEEEEEVVKKPGFFDEWREILRNEDKSAFWVLLGIFCYFFGFNALEYSFGRFATSFLQISEGTASLLIAIMPVMLIVFAILAGTLATKYGRLLIMRLGLVIMAIGIVGIIIFIGALKPVIDSRPLTMVDLIPLIVLLSLGGIGYGFSTINALPVVWQLSPRDKIGAYTGVYYMVSALGAIISPLAMGTIFFLVRSAGGDQWLALFPYFLVAVIIGLIFLLKVKHGDAEPLTDEELARLRSAYLTDS